MTTTIIDSESLPCGCKLTRALVDGERALILDPCSPMCSTYADAITEARIQGKPIEFTAEDPTR